MVDKITESMPSISNLGGAAQKVEKVGAGQDFSSFMKDATEKKRETLKKRIKDIQNKIKEKNANKNITLTTSRANYIDPRITVAFFKNYDIPIEKAFSKTLMKNFVWALDTPKSYTFSTKLILSAMGEQF